jgi:uroporphyrinogen-III synthase
VLLHSPRAAETFARLAPDRGGVRIAGISETAAQAAGEGWASRHAAAAPRDEALLELAAALCHIASPDAAAAGL